MDIKLSYYHLGAVAALYIGLMWWYPIVFYLSLFIFYTLILISCAILGTLYFQYNKTKPEPVVPKPVANNILYNVTRNRIFDSPKRPKNQNQVIFGRTIDSVITQIIDNALRDFVHIWMSKIVNDPKVLIENLKEDLWNALQKLVDRARKIDAPKLIAVDVVTKIIKHLQKIREIQIKAQETGEIVEFTTSSYLQSDEKELEFLKKLSEILLIMLLPRGYSLSPLKDLLCEIIAFKVFFNSIKLITSPDFINQRIVLFIESKLAEIALNRRSYEYATSFQDFLKIINNSTSMDELLSIRTSIISDLVQATTTQNLQRAKGIDIDSGNTSELKRSEISAALKLKRYIQQLSFAKSHCEKNLTKLGWNGGEISNDLNLSLTDILATVTGRRYFTRFLESLNASNLIGYYTTVEELKHAPKSNLHQLCAEIFYTYIRAPNSEIKLDKKDRNKMETFLIGENGPEIFFEVQKGILKLLEEKYYHPFLLCDEYQQLKNTITSEDIKEISINTFKNSTDSNNPDQDQADGSESESDDFNLDLTNHSTYARNKLDQLQEKLKNKNLAFEALKASLKPEATVLSILEKEIEWLKNEKRELEAHLLRTSIWTEHLGKWRATVESVEVNEDKDTPQFVIVVQVDELPKEAKEDEVYEADNVSTGWVVLRSLDDFHELHRKIKPLCTELKSLDLPSNNTFILFFVKNDKTSLEKAKAQIQRYLNFILEDDNLNQCEALYTFLSPSSDRLKQIEPSPKKTKFSFSTLFRTGSGTESSKSDSFWGASEMENEDISLFIDGAVLDDAEQQQQNGTNSDSKDNKLEIDNRDRDSIAEPIYVMIGEVFDMGGLFKWVRKSLISFVQITYGGTINRQIRDLINSWFEETNLHFYVTTILKTVWPGGQLIDLDDEERTDNMKEMTAVAAKSLLLDNIPDLLSNLVGSQNAKHGAIKIFEILQNETYNKQIVYDMLEILMLELFPELVQLKPSQTTEHSTNFNNEK